VSEASFVVHKIVAALVLTDPAPTAEMAGGVVSGGAVVVKVKFGDTAGFPAASTL
jgi:hypothetical protein